MLIKPAKSINGDVVLPGDKSISHRAAIIASLAEGDSRIENFSRADDCASTIRCLRQLGVEIEGSENELVIHGVGRYGFRKPAEPLDCGNSGTTMRLLAGLLASQEFESILTGDESLKGRPMRRIVEPLQQMGADITAADGRPPLTIRPVTGLKAINYKMPVASAQVKSCLLLAGLFAHGETTIIETETTRDHTERMLRGFGVEVTAAKLFNENRLTIANGSNLAARKFCVPADVSAASFFIIGAACLPGSDITIAQLGVNPTRAALLNMIADIGGKIEITQEQLSLGEPYATVRFRSNGLDNAPVRIAGAQIAELIDEIPILAVLGTKMYGGLEVRDAAELRVKETDRISTVVENLRRMKADVEEFDDGLRVRKSQLSGAEVDSFGDHRIAMAFGIAGLLGQGDTVIKNVDCANVSFPGFFEVLESVAQR
ncbi:MAG: 3-phosphoshikimate 1-carboxyvinyltransferase [Pyrinomonadaceae bacterium]